MRITGQLKWQSGAILLAVAGMLTACGGSSVDDVAGNDNPESTGGAGIPLEGEPTIDLVALEEQRAEFDAAIDELETAIASARVKLARLKDYDEISRLVSIYGFYVDKSMHDNVADLFNPDGVVEILGRGVFVGEERIRQYMHNLSPVGPRDGALFNHMQFQPVINIADDGLTANVRARLFVMFGIEGTNAQWGSGIYENTFIKRDGRWMIDYLHGYQTFYTLYEDGWANRASAIFAPYDRLPPDFPQSVSYDPYPAAFVPPFHYVNPVSGRDDYYADPAWSGPPQDSDL